MEIAMKKPVQNEQDKIKKHLTDAECFIRKTEQFLNQEEVTV